LPSKITIDLLDEEEKNHGHRDIIERDTPVRCLAHLIHGHDFAVFSLLQMILQQSNSGPVLTKTYLA
jgi:hypothetical protein